MRKCITIAAVTVVALLVLTASFEPKSELDDEHIADLEFYGDGL